MLADGNPDIAKLTDAAMNGEIPLDQVYAKRLEMIRPSKDRVEQLGATYVASIVDGAKETIATLVESCRSHILEHDATIRKSIGV